MHNHPHIFFVLSAGRTGTVFLANELGRNSSSTMVVHEPWPGRYGLILANMRRRFGTSGWLLCLLLKIGLKYRLKRSMIQGNRNYVEINPFLCACTDLLPRLGYEYKIIHIVRSPINWARSITMFRASKYRRHFIHFVPFAMPFPEPRPNGWQYFSDTEKAIWRWRFCNEQIEALKTKVKSYLLVRYEDIFSDNPQTKKALSKKIYLFLGIEENNEWFDSRRKINKAPDAPDGGPIKPGFAKEVAAPLAKRLGYEIHDET